MSSRLAFQTQLASIMEVLANAAVAEICKLVDDNYAVVSLQMSQCQKENKALKRKLHLLELKMARGTAERRLRESAFNSGRLRVQIRDASPSADGAFEQQSVSMWPDRALTASVTEHNERPQSKSPDVQFVEPVIVKEETKAEAKEEEIHVIEDNGLMECTPHAPERLKHNLEIQPSASNQVQTCAKPRTQTPPRPPRRNSATNRRVEEEDPDVVLVKVEEPEEMEEQKLKPNTPGLSIQEGLVESSTDDFKASLPFVDASQISTDPLQDSAQGISESDSGDLLLKITVPSQSAAGSDFSLFELEPFFARWAPDSDPAAPPGGSFGASVSAESEKSDVITVDDDKDRFMSVTGEQLQTSVSQALPSASSLSSIQIQSVHSQWTPAMLQNPLVLQNIRTPQQTHTNSNVPVSNSSTSASSSSAASSSINQHQISVQSHNSLKLKVGKKFICKTCGKPFPAWSNLEVHQRVHTGERPFKCDTCGKRFSEAGNLKKHQRVHTGEKPYSCNKCGKKFAWICNLKTHQQTATGCIQHQAWSAKE